VPAHAGSLEDLDILVDRTVAEFGGIDVVVNNAANTLAQPLGEITVEGWTKSNEVNVRGPVFLAQKALPHLKESKHAAVLNLVSVGAFNFAADMSIYAAGKAAVMSYTRSMAAAFVGDGIRVNAIAPGPVDTDMMRNNPQQAIDGMVGRNADEAAGELRRDGRRGAAVVFGCGQLHHGHGGDRRRWRNASLASASCSNHLCHFGFSSHRGPGFVGGSN
jgi:NAD(P)-dependent dehydrogenase (short-subunit alcohol dehydrogenase family)